MRTLCLLGASGSIGTQSLDILRNDRNHFELRAFSVGHRVDQIPNWLKEFPSVTHVCVQEEADKAAFAAKYPQIVWYSGDVGLLSMIDDCGAEMVENALVGFAGLCPSIRALEDNKILCLANKESLVVGGDIINGLLSKGKGKLYPIDSEHVAIAKLFSRVKREDVERLLITASGGSFRDKKRSELFAVSPSDALAHPTWSMGAKITIDSATMMNKGFEVIEAKVLFDFPLEKTEILMHRESHVHSVLQLKDGSYLADVSAPDMHGPIAYALYESHVDFELAHVKELSELGPYTFYKFDPERYLAPGLALKAFEKGGTSRAVLNGANEAAVYAFLDGKLPFLGIDIVVEKAIDELPCIANPTLEQIKKADKEARAYVASYLRGE